MLIKKTEKIILKIFLFFPIFFYFGKRSLIAYDEGYYAIQARWILDKANWIVPMWWDTLVTDRTIAIQSLFALCIKIFGNSFFALYLPILVSSILMLFFTFQLHKELIGDKYPLFSTLILSSTFLWITYANMATQDILFSSIVTFGILSSIKAKKTNKYFYIFLSGLWIGLAVMFKTYLTVIPFLSLLPFLLSSKIIFKRYFWIGFFIGFLPFLIWTYNYISLYSYSTYSGIFRKLLRLSKNNTFSQPTYYYLWNFTANIFPWSILSTVGFLKSFNSNSLKKYFLFFYPILVITLLSLFSTKTPYYPLQILSLTSLNAYLGIKYIIQIKDNRIKYLERFNYIFIPIILLLSSIIINFTSLIPIDFRGRVFITIGLILFSLSWISYSFLKNKKRKMILSILGPYILITMLVQSGLITDKSKSLRIAVEDLIRTENISNVPIKVDQSEPLDDNSMSKIIKIMTQFPQTFREIKDLDQLENKNYAWTIKNINDKNNFYIVNKNDEFYPWKLIFKK